MVFRKGDPTRKPELTPAGIRAANSAWRRLAVIYGCGWTDSDLREGFPPFPLEHRMLLMRAATHYLKEHRDMFQYGEFMRLLNVSSKGETVTHLKVKK